MKGGTPLEELIDALASGLVQPRHAWEAITIAISLVLAGIAARTGNAVLTRRRERLAKDRIEETGAVGSAASARVAAAARLAAHLPSAIVPPLLFPLIALALFWVGEGVLRWRHVLNDAGDARLLRLASTLVGALALVRILIALLRSVLKSNALITHFERAIVLVAILGVGLYATGVLGDVVDWLQATHISVGSSTGASLWTVIAGSVMTLVSLLTAMWLGSIVDARLRAETGIEANLRTVLARVARAILLIVAVLVGLALSGIDLTVLSVFGGALGVGLGLGLQRIASNYVSGFILLLDRSLRIGDKVTVSTYSGTVMQINTRYTVLRALDGTEAIVPNEMFVSSAVLNQTRSDPHVALQVTVPVAPTVDLPLAYRLLVEAAAVPPRVLKDPAPTALLKDFSSGNLLIAVEFFIADADNGKENVQAQVALAVWERFRANGVELAVPRSEVQGR